MRLPSTVEEAYAETERSAAWLRKRFPDILLWVNESFGSMVAFWSYASMPSTFSHSEFTLQRWPQAIDELLEDMGLRTMRCGGNWLTWPFKVVSVNEIATLAEERRAKREANATQA